MKKIPFLGIPLFLILQNFSFAQRANHIVISEFAPQGPAGGQDEFVELYNPTEEDVSIAGWHIQYKPVNGGAWSDRAVFPPNTSIPAHGFFLAAHTSYVGSDSADYRSSLWTGTIGLSSLGHLQIVNSADTVIDKVGYGASAIDPEGTPAPSMILNTQSIERKAFATSTADSLAPGGLHYLEGNGYDSDNNGFDFVLQTNGRRPQTSRSVPEPAFGVGGSGTGSISVSPARVFSSRVQTLTFTISADSGYILTQFKLVVPTTWSWSRSPDDLQLSGPGFDSAIVALSGDTVLITQAGVTYPVAGVLTMSQMLAPSSNATSVFRWFTGVEGGAPAQILIQPRIKIVAPIPIISVHVNDAQGIAASPFQVGAEVTVTGTVTANLSPAYTNIFLQDETAGINIYSPALPIVFEVGDSVVLTGSILQFRGLTEISPDFTVLQIVAKGRPVPEPRVITCSDVNGTFQPDYSEPDEGRLVRINGVSYNSVDGTITDRSGTALFFSPFPILYSQFDVVGILKQYTNSYNPPFVDSYEIQPRSESDIFPHPGPVVTSGPSEDSIRSDAVRIVWNTDVPSSSVVLFGQENVYSDSVADGGLTVDHVVWLTGLTPATTYDYAVASTDSNGRTMVSGFLFGTASPPGTTGEMNAYFNDSVNTSVSLWGPALENQDLVSRLVTRMNNARRSIDACFYNLSGTPGASVADALVQARGRGVLVRVICEADNRANAPFSTIASSGIPLITDEFDPLTNGTGLMHDKFVVIDARGGAPESVWVWTGSWNPTAPGTNDDRQNAIEIQDVSLALAYTSEFNEMWGSSTQSPNAGLSRFGSRKKDDTPHRFVINGSPVECYFSPSDRTTSAIARTLARAEHSASVAIYTFTRRDLADTLKSLKNRGRKVRVVMDNNTDTGTQFSSLVAGGIDVHLKGFDTGFLHHKYALVDATSPSAKQWTITGSHNWSNSAETSNNENTLIINDNRITNFYLQEFYARYLEAGGTDSVVLAVKELNASVPTSYELRQNYPNPFNPETRIQFSLPSQTHVDVKIFDLLGREVAVLLSDTRKAGTYEVTWNPGNLSGGVYFCTLRAGMYSSTMKMLYMK